MAYHITGIISSVIFLLTLGGLWSQLGLIFERRRLGLAGTLKERPTAVLSLNQFVSSFLAFFSFFLYGACLARFNHYLVWSRLAASLLTLLVLFEMFRDRSSLSATLSFFGSLALLVVAPMMLLWNPAGARSGKLVSEILIVAITAILAQGYLHQVWLIRNTGQTGAVSIRMHQCFLLKDIATIAFALTMGLPNGWPLLLLSSVSGITKAITLWHFHWVRTSPLAAIRREKLSARAQEDFVVMN